LLSEQADVILSLLDEPSETPGWKWSSRSPVSPTIAGPKPSDQTSKISSVLVKGPSTFIAAIENACNRVIKAEPEITRMDTIAGDGDCGLTLKEGASGVLEAIKEGKIKGDDVVSSLIAIARVAEEKMGGTSGALYS
jgi:dihydroxyacetone kinase